MQARIARGAACGDESAHRADVVSSEMIRDIGADDRRARVRLTILLAADDPALARAQVRQSLERVDGVTDVRVDVEDPSQVKQPSAPSPPPAPRRRGRTLPVMGQEPQSRRAAVPAPTPVAYPEPRPHHRRLEREGRRRQVHRRRRISPSRWRSGGARVGLMDADIYGPNIPRMMGVNEPPPVVNETIMPLEAHGVKLIASGSSIERDQPAIWRGPIVMKIITQFLRDVEWGELDYFLVDMPPGTGDAQLSLVQATHVHGAVIVTTPQEVASATRCAARRCSSASACRCSASSRT